MSKLWPKHETDFYKRFIRADFETGLLYWKEDSPNGKYKKGMPVSLCRYGRGDNKAVTFTLPAFASSSNKVSSMVHHVVWFLAYGEQPKRQIRHADGVNHNNSLSNLYEAGTEPQFNKSRPAKTKPVIKPVTRQGAHKRFINPHKFTHYRNGENTLISGDSLPVALC